MTMIVSIYDIYISGGKGWKFFYFFIYHPCKENFLFLHISNTISQFIKKHLMKAVLWFLQLNLTIAEVILQLQAQI